MSSIPNCRRAARRASLAALLLASSLVGTSAVASTPPPSASPPQPATALTFDEALAAVAADVPGFGGAWLEDGALVVALARGGGEETAAQARRELASLLGRPDLEGTRVVARPVHYAFDELKAWHDAVSREALALPGAVSSDVDERTNVVRIGTSDVAGTEARIRSIAAAHGVPARALVVEHAEPVADQLRDRNIPVVGGVEISWIEPKGVSIYQCTLGFPAVREGVLGYVTNSHCTALRATVDTTVHQQPVFGVPIGREIADPPHVASAACPVGRLCRYSDSAFLSLHVDSLYNHGHVARPPQGGIAWNGVDTFRITAEATPIMGETVTKVGRTSGRTSGPVKATCKTYNVISFNLTMLCQGQADFSSSGGDSGSPVFVVGAGNDITLTGIHWGSGGVFSPIDGIQRDTELGPLTTCAVGFGC